MIPQTFPNQDILVHDPDAIAVTGIFHTRSSSLDILSTNTIDKLRESSLKSKGNGRSHTKKLKKVGKGAASDCPVPHWLLNHVNDSIQSQHGDLKEEDEPSLTSSDVSEDSSHSRTSDKSFRRVRFDVDDGCGKGVKVEVLGPLLKPSSQMTQREKEEVYWTRSDYAEFKRNIQAIFADAFQGCEVLPGSYSMTLQKTYQACCSTKRQTGESAIISPRIRSDLEEWTRAAQSRRGLESVSVPFLSDARRKTKASIIRPLIQLQSKMDEGMFDPDLKAEILRNFSRRRSRSSALFAQVLAGADEAALCKPFKTGVAHRRFTAI